MSARTADSGHPAGASDGLPRSLVAAVAVIGAQAVALVVAAVIVLAKVVLGHPHSLAGALFLAAWAAIGALILLFCGRLMLRLRPAARTPVVVIELVALPVSYSLTFQAHRLEYGAPILISALLALYLLFTPASRSALERK